MCEFDRRGKLSRNYIVTGKIARNQQAERRKDSRLHETTRAGADDRGFEKFEVDAEKNFAADTCGW